MSENWQELLEVHRALWLAQARTVALELGKDGRELTVDDIREVCPIPAEFDPRVMGAVFRTPEWERLGYVQSRRRLCHNRPIRVFRRIF